MTDSSAGGDAQLLSSLTNLAQYVLGNNSNTQGTQTTSGSGNTAAENWSQQDVATSGEDSTQSWINSIVQAVSQTNTTNLTANDTKTNNLVQNSADPFAIAGLKQVAQTAISNSTDPSKTTGLISGLLQNAGDTIGQIFGTQRGQGIYNASATTNQTNDVLSRATADAASAVLGYDVSQQQIANTSLTSLGNLTSSQQTTGDVSSQGSNLTQTNTGTTTTTNTNQFSDEKSNVGVNTAVAGGSNTQTSQQAQQQTQSNTKTGLSVVCTWMHQNSRLGLRKYATITADFLRKPEYQQDAYHIVAAPMVRWLKATSGKGLISFFILWLFSARTDYVCAVVGLRGCNRSVEGWIARAIVAIICTPVALGILGKQKIWGQIREIEGV